MFYMHQRSERGSILNTTLCTSLWKPVTLLAKSGQTHRESERGFDLFKLPSAKNDDTAFKVGLSFKVKASVQSSWIFWWIIGSKYAILNTAGRCCSQMWLFPCFASQFDRTYTLVLASFSLTLLSLSVGNKETEAGILPSCWRTYRQLQTSEVSSCSYYTFFFSSPPSPPGWLMHSWCIVM